MNLDLRKGWFKVDGIRPNGDRSIAEQMLGLDRALAEAKGKTVLDLGCAEGAISLEFAKAGAARVVGVELLEAHLVVARKLCAAYAKTITFVCAHLDTYALARPDPERFDIVLALGIIHKLQDPAVPLRFAARSAKDLLCFRAPATVEPAGGDYVIKAKHSGVVCNVPAVMRSEGFRDEGTIKGVRGEGVQYWRRV